jgi:hypothetical protein
MAGRDAGPLVAGCDAALPVIADPSIAAVRSHTNIRFMAEYVSKPGALGDAQRIAFG